MAHVARLEAARTQLLVIDVQARLVPHIFQHESVVSQIVRMIRAGQQLGLPTVLTEQYVKGLGATADEVLAAAKECERFEKATFSACGDAKAFRAMKDNVRNLVLVAGIETHVCVQQTVLDLLEKQMTPFVLADAVSSRRERDREVALTRMRDSGAVVTTVEAAIFEMLDRCDTDLFKRILPIVK